jgi:hypothetical protein
MTRPREGSVVAAFGWMLALATVNGWESQASRQGRRAGNEKEMVGLARWQHRRSHRWRYHSQFFHG